MAGVLKTRLLDGVGRWMAAGQDLNPSGQLTFLLGVLACGVSVVAFFGGWLATLSLLALTLLAVPWFRFVFHLRLSETQLARGRMRERVRTIFLHLPFALTGIGLLLALWSVQVAATPPTTEDLQPVARLYVSALCATWALGIWFRGSRIRRVADAFAQSPARMTAAAFASLALVGTLLLTHPALLESGKSIRFIDAFFISISAVCVTGLVTLNVATTFNTLGEAVILFLFQVGGLGLMIVSSAFVVFAGRQLRLRSKAVLAEAIDAPSLAALKSTVLGVLQIALFLELLGAAILFFSFRRPQDTLLETAWVSVFHSVSAFCNAGFTNRPDGLVPYVNSLPVNAVVMVLIVVGGLGFPVLRELLERLGEYRSGKRPRVLSLHARIVLTVSALMIVALAGAILILEWNAALNEFSFGTTAMTALFQSVTARTAGFNTVDIGALRMPTLLLLCIAMFIGASPGSTGGGVKTTTLAAMLASFRSEVTGRKHPWCFGRRISLHAVRRALGVFFLSALLVALTIFGLLLTEPMATLSQVTFEAYSAFATVGLSTGITSSLSPEGKCIIVCAMFVGRIGPLTFALALASQSRTEERRYVEEEILIA